MLKTYIENINKGIEVRQNLIKLKEELKDSSNVYAIRYELGEGNIFFEKLLSDEDAKVRKNAALIMGKLGEQEYLVMLYDAYKKEEQRFVKTSYLTAIGELDYREILPDLKDNLEDLKNIELDDSNRKHIAEERKQLTELILSVEGIQKHVFNGYNKKSDVILITNRNHMDVTLRQIEALSIEDSDIKDAKAFNAGVMLSTKNLKDIMEIRTYRELLFVLEDVKSCDKEADVAAKALAKSSLYKFLKERHKGAEEYYFRVEYKGKLELDKKSAFTKKFAATLEQFSNGKLINSTSNYEIEIRLIENNVGRLNVLVKLFTIEDERFSYRVNTVAASINPVNAALVMELAEEYLKRDAKVLDPFCGVGTMIIERHRYMKCNTLYGIDIFGPAIDKARENTEKAGVIAHYTNKDFFEFEHEYVFDEIITNMPRITGHKTEKEIEDIFKRFFAKAPSHLVEDAIMVLHVYESELVEKYANKTFEMLKKFELSKKERSYMYILKKR